MKRYLFFLVICMSLFFTDRTAAEEAAYAGREEFDIPDMAEEIEALTGDTEETGNDSREKQELYRLLQKDTALAGYQEKAIQSTYDPREKQQVTAVRNQSSNTCWAFSTLGAGEMSLVRKGLADPATLDLSEAHLTYFFYHSQEDPLGNTKGDGNHNISDSDFMAVGSNTIFSTFALANWTGAASESSAPFEDLTPQTQYQASMAYADAAHLQNAYWINFKDVDAVNVTKQMIQKYGGAAINFYWNRIYYNEKNSAYYAPLDLNRANNHSVTIVGWDDTYAKENFEEGCRPKEDGAWIVKNSYGESWGDNGYFYLSYEDSAVSAENTNANRARAYIFDFEPADNYDYNYQYDGSAGAYNATNPDSPLTKVPSGGAIANVFSVNSRENTHEETLKAVAFALFDTAVSYSVQIYKNPSEASDPTSGTPELSVPVTGSTSYAGYYTIPLNETVSLTEGDVFSVVVTLEKESGGEIDFFVDKTYQNGNWISFTNQVSEGESFRLTEGSWEDMAANGVTARIKAFTDSDVTQAAKKLTLSDTSLKLKVGESAALSAELTPAQTAGEEIVWEASGNAATVDQSGVIKAENAGESDVKAYLKSDETIYAVCKVEVVKAAGSSGTDQTAVEADGASVTQTSPSSPTKSANTSDPFGRKAGFWIMILMIGIVLLRIGKNSSIVEQ